MTKLSEMIAGGRIISISELEKQEKPDAGEVLKTLEDYTKKGHTIDPRAAIKVIDRANLNREQLALARQYALHGRDRQHERHSLEAEQEYIQLSAAISFILDSFD